MTSSSEDSAHRNLQIWIRIIHILCNFILSLLGIGGIGLSTLTMIDYFNELELFDHYETLNVHVFLISSVVLTIISWIGIYAGIKNCSKSSLTNGLLLNGFIIATTGYVTMMNITTNYTKTGDLYEQIKKEMNNYDQNPHYIDILQTTLLCCGLDGVNTWNNSDIPESCCRHSQNVTCTLQSPNLQTNGCFEEFVRIGRYYVWLLYSILASSVLVEIFAITLSHLQYRIIKDKKKKKPKKSKISKDSVTQHEENEKVRDKQEEATKV